MLKIGLIGAGVMGKTHSMAYKQIADECISAVCDIDKEKAENIAKQWEAEVFTSIEQMLQEGEFDAVDICLPTHFHRSVVELAAQYRKPIFCEKPIAHTMKDAKEMVEICEISDKSYLRNQL